MSLRKKAFIVFVVTLTLVVGLVYLLSRTVILKRFERLETLEATRNMERVRDTINQEYEQLLSTGVDWGYWSETYEFIISRDEAYIEGNLNDLTISNLELNLMLYLDSKGDLVYGTAMDLEAGVQVPVPRILALSIMEDNSFSERNLQKENIHGLLVQPGVPPLFFASIPILDDNGEGPVRGSLVLGKYLTPSLLEKFNRITKVELTMETGDQLTREPGWDIKPETFTGENEIFTRHASPTALTGVLLLNDFHGKPALAIKGEIKRDIYLMGQTALHQFLLLTIIFTIAVSTVAWLLLEKIFLKRLYQVINQVSNIRKTKNSGTTVTISGADELSLLVKSINGMLEAIHESHHLYKSLITTTPIPIMATDTEGNIAEWNPAAEKTFGWSREEILGQFVPMLPAKEKDEFEKFRKKLFTGANLASFEATWLRKGRVPIELHVYPSRLINFDGRISGSIIVMTDITDIKNRDLQLRRTLAEKDMLLKEVHHRIKNNLQAISSILDIQKLHLNNTQLAEIFRESQSRIRSMALIHEELYNSRDHVLVNTSQYIGNLLNHLFYSYNVDRERVALNLEVDELLLNIDTAIPCGLIINELVSNTLKYAFNGHKDGVVHVSLKTVGEVYRLRITDNGIGLPEDMDIRTVNSLGMILVRSLADQLHSSVKVSRKGGTSFEFHFKVYEECQKSKL